MTPEQINEIECRVAALRRGIEPLAGTGSLWLVRDALQLASDARELLIELRRARAALDSLR